MIYEGNVGKAVTFHPYEEDQKFIEKIKKYGLGRPSKIIRDALRYYLNNVVCNNEEFMSKFNEKEQKNG